VSRQQLYEPVHRQPEDEPPVDPEMLKRIDAARTQGGPGIPHEEILREFGS
jgi:hypothetical protein